MISCDYISIFLNTTPPSIKLEATITAVRSIKKQQLVEVRSMANPPSVVKMALESICTLLGEKGDTWKGIRSVVMKDNFISTIVNFETENVTLVSYCYVHLAVCMDVESKICSKLYCGKILGPYRLLLFCHTMNYIDK